MDKHKETNTVWNRTEIHVGVAGGGLVLFVGASTGLPSSALEFICGETRVHMLQLLC